MIPARRPRRRGGHRTLAIAAAAGMLLGMATVPDDLDRIQRLRELFLAADRGRRALPDYWRDDRDLAAYDRVLAARIGWKWDAALAECAARGWRAEPAATVLDFGCGTGVAARRYVARFGAGEVLLHDRSAAAMRYAGRAFAAAAPAVPARALADVDAAAPDVLLVSHVLGELDERGLQQLRALIARSARVLVVEAGDRATARRLQQLRDELVATFHVVAPCPHRAACPALARRRDWCHFFAPPPPEVFPTGTWAVTARELGIDLRALPYAFVALDRAAPAVAPPPNRVLGRPAIGKHDARVRVCTPGELALAAVGRRARPELWRALKKRPETVRSLDDLGDAAG